MPIRPERKALQAEIKRLINVVRYSQKKESDDAAREICKLQKKLLEAGE